jgi:hypothetical protein
VRAFFVLLLDSSRRDLQITVDYDLAGFDYTLLRRGMRLEALPPALRLFVSQKKRTDLLSNAFQWKIVSERVVHLIRELVPETDLEVFPAPTFDVQAKTPISGYYLLNSLRPILGAGARKTGEPLSADRVVIDESRVPSDVHLFFLEEQPSLWILSARLADRLSGCVGLSLFPTRSVS